MSADRDSARACDHAYGCITCSDEGVPMRVVAATSEAGVALCSRADGQRSEVMTGLVGEVGVGDVLLVHAGTALLRLDRPEDSGP